MPLIQPRQSQKKPTRFPIKALFIFIALGFVIVWWVRRPPAVVPQPQAPLSSEANKAVELAKRELKSFSGSEFVELYNSFAYPNVREFEIVPSITGNAAADERIRNLALSRGYRARSIAIPPLADVGNYQLQERAAKAWEELTSAAKNDGLDLSMTAGFRTISDQQELFMNALNATGATTASITADNSNFAVLSVLRTIAIPGYTRHHSGYTVDIGCDSQPNVVFGASRCFGWLSRDNYKNAKSYGWIPSYPDGAPEQGPEPEAWEYSWVGVDALMQSTAE